MRFNSDDGTKPDRAVLAQLKQVDPTVYPVWRNWYMDMRTGRRLYRENGEPIHHPQWYIVKECADGRHRVILTTPYFDYRVPYRLRSDAGRHLPAKKINQMLDALREESDVAPDDEATGTSVKENDLSEIPIPDVSTGNPQ